MNEQTKTLPIEDLSFEDALRELETIVQSLESGQAKLAESIGAYERGIALKKHCEAQLRAAQEKIETITVTPDGAVETAPFES